MHLKSFILLFLKSQIFFIVELLPRPVPGGDQIVAGGKPIPYSFKRLTGSDVPLLKELLGVFGEAFEEPETYQGRVPDDGYLGSLLAQEHFIVLVAQSGESTVGGLVAYVLDKFEQQRREIYIYDLAVLKDHRRHGVATALIRQLRQIGKESGAYVIFVQADRGDIGAIKLYQSLGRREDVYHFDIGVE